MLLVHDAVTPEAIKKSWEAPAIDSALVTAAFLMLIELALVTAIAIFFSTFTTPVLAAGFTTGLVVAGHFGADLKNFETVVDSSVMQWMARGLYYLLPNLSSFDVKLQVVHGHPITPSYVLVTTAYGAVYMSRSSWRPRSSSRERTSSGARACRARTGADARGGARLRLGRPAGVPRPALPHRSARGADPLRPVAGSRPAAWCCRTTSWPPTSTGSGPSSTSEGPAFRGEQNPKYELLYPLLDLATSLDPYFNIAYRFGSTFLSQGPPVGPGRPDLAIELLEKGLRHQPRRWQYMQDAGFVHYWAKQDYRAAAAWFERASRVPGAPSWLKSLTGVTLAQGGERATSRFIFRAIVESAEDKWTREDAARRLRQLDAMDQRDVLRRVVAAYRARGGAVPMTWQSIAAAGYLRGIPNDPDGFVYALDPWSGDVTLGEKSTLLPLPAEKPPASSSTPPA